jgi:hypothetical protein
MFCFSGSAKRRTVRAGVLRGADAMGGGEWRSGFFVKKTEK